MHLLMKRQAQRGPTKCLLKCKGAKVGGGSSALQLVAASGMLGATVRFSACPILQCDDSVQTCDEILCVTWPFISKQGKTPTLTRQHQAGFGGGS